MNCLLCVHGPIILKHYRKCIGYFELVTQIIDNFLLHLRNRNPLTLVELYSPENFEIHK